MKRWTQHAGRVVTREGEAVPLAMVAVESGTAPTPEIALETDELGRFQLALPDGEFVIAAHAADGRSGRCSVVGESAEEIRIQVGDAPPADA